MEKTGSKLTMLSSIVERDRLIEVASAFRKSSGCRQSYA
jgi:hypothetical protein